MRYRTIFLLLLWLPACGKKTEIPVALPVADCHHLGSLSAEERTQICPFYDAYSEALDKKEVTKLLVFISSDYKGKDGLNATAIKKAMSAQIAGMPWQKIQYEEFMVKAANSSFEIVHRMRVTLPNGSQMAVRERIDWRPEGKGNWRITNWQHKL